MTSRRRFLAAVGTGTGLAATAGCLRLTEGGTNDVSPTDWVAHPAYFNPAANRPDHDALSTRDPAEYAPFVVRRPDRLDQVISDQPYRLVRDRLSTPTIERTAGASEADLVIHGSHYAVLFGVDTSSVRDRIDDDIYELDDDDSGTPFEFYVSDPPFSTIAVDDSRVVVGEPMTPDSSRRSAYFVTSSQQTSVELHRDEVPDLEVVVDEAGTVGHLVVAPAGTPAESTPKRGVFAGETAFAYGLDPGADETDVVVVRAFESDAPSEDALRTWLDSETTPLPADADLSVDDRLATARTTKPTDDLTVADFSGQCRDVRETFAPADGTFQEVADGEHEVVVSATRGAYEPLASSPPTVPSGEALTMHVVAETLLGTGVEDLGVRGLSLPGEVMTVRKELSSAGTYDVVADGVDLDGEDYSVGTLVVGGRAEDTLVATEREAVTVTVGPDGDLVFDPKELVISAGTTVTWEWDTDNHNVVVDSQPDGAEWDGTPGDDSTVYDTGYVYEHTFETPGQYEYYCETHVGAGQVGDITVL